MRSSLPIRCRLIAGFAAARAAPVRGSQPELCSAIPHGRAAWQLKALEVT